MSFVVVGLGNPGREYERTRHNIGRAAVAFFVGESSWVFDKRANAQIAETDTATFVLPETYMNRSGRAVARYIKKKQDAANLVVVYDDIDLPLGKIKISFGRGSGGHNGVESIINAVGTKQFVRLRIGVSPSGGKGIAKKPKGEEKVLQFLMSDFRKTEEAEVERVLKMASEALDVIITNGYVHAMNRFNQEE